MGRGGAVAGVRRVWAWWPGWGNRTAPGASPLGPAGGALAGPTGPAIWNLLWDRLSPPLNPSQVLGALTALTSTKPLRGKGTCVLTPSDVWMMAVTVPTASGTTLEVPGARPRDAARAGELNRSGFSAAGPPPIA